MASAPAAPPALPLPTHAFAAGGAAAAPPAVFGCRGGVGRAVSVSVPDVHRKLILPLPPPAPPPPLHPPAWCGRGAGKWSPRVSALVVPGRGESRVEGRGGWPPSRTEREEPTDDCARGCCGGGAASWLSTAAICERSTLRRCTSAASSEPVHERPDCIDIVGMDERLTDESDVCGRACIDAAVPHAPIGPAGDGWPHPWSSLCIAIGGVRELERVERRNVERSTSSRMTQKKAMFAGLWL